MAHSPPKASTAPPSVLFIVDSRRGHVTQRARAGIYLPFFEKAGWTTRLLDFAEVGEKQILEHAKDFELIYLVKVASFALVRRLRELGSARLVFDFCDRLWSRERQKAGWHDLDRILSEVDVVFAENAAIKAYAGVHNPRVFHVPDSAQVELFDAARKILAVDSSNEVEKAPGTIRIGWVGSPGNIGALEKIRGPLLRLSARHPELEVRVMGARPADAARILDGIPYTLLPDYNEEAMVREMLAMDIGLFPPPFDYEDYRARGPLKALLYMAAGMAVVCERGGDCRWVIEEGKTGMLADSPAEWEAKLEVLLTNPELRKQMGQAALEEVRRRHSLSLAFETLRTALEEVLRFPARAPSPPRSLFARWFAV